VYEMCYINKLALPTRSIRHTLQKTKQKHTPCLSKLSFYSALWKQKPPVKH